MVGESALCSLLRIQDNKNTDTTVHLQVVQYCTVQYSTVQYSKKLTLTGGTYSKYNERMYKVAGIGVVYSTNTKVTVYTTSKSPQLKK